MRNLKIIFPLLLTSIFVTNASASEGGVCKTKAPHIWACVKEVKINLNDEEFVIKRSGSKKISSLYESTNRGKVQPITLDEDIETIGEIGFIEYMKKAQNDKSIIIVDTRSPGWFARLTIPGAVNMPYTEFNNLEDAELYFDDLGVIKNKDGKWDFTNAKKVIAFCNGYWCGQTPAMVLYSKYALVKMGYPKEKIKYYRGGMQAWTSLGLTVVGDEAK